MKDKDCSVNVNSLQHEIFTTVSSPTKVLHKVESGGLDHVAVEESSLSSCFSVTGGKTGLTESDKYRDDKRQEEPVCDSVRGKKLLDGDLDSSKIQGMLSEEVAIPSSDAETQPGVLDKSLESTNLEDYEKNAFMLGSQKGKGEKPTRESPPQNVPLDMTIHAQASDDDAVPDSLTKNHYDLPSRTEQRNLLHLEHSFTPLVGQFSRLQRGKHIQYEDKNVRRSSYSCWPAGKTHKPEILVDAGFFYAGFGDCVRCWFCGGGLRNWEDGETPWIEHARWYPSCEYLIQRKGDLFIEMHRQNRDQEDPWIPPQMTEEEYDIAFRSALEMGYSKSSVISAVEHLRKQGKSKYTAVDIMKIILDQEERQTLEPSTTTIKSNTSSTSSAAGASVQSKTSIASADSKSLMKENQTLKEQMLCKICLDKDASIVYLPCGHMVTCQDCAPT